MTGTTSEWSHKVPQVEDAHMAANVGTGRYYFHSFVLASGTWRRCSDVPR